MKVTHDYAARIDFDLWMDCLRVKELGAATTSINSMVNEGLKIVMSVMTQGESCTGADTTSWRIGCFYAANV